MLTSLSSDTSKFHSKVAMRKSGRLHALFGRSEGQDDNARGHRISFRRLRSPAVAGVTLPPQGTGQASPSSYLWYRLVANVISHWELQRAMHSRPRRQARRYLWLAKTRSPANWQRNYLPTQILTVFGIKHTKGFRVRMVIWWPNMRAFWQELQGLRIQCCQTGRRW